MVWVGDGLAGSQAPSSAASSVKTTDKSVGLVQALFVTGFGALQSTRYTLALAFDVTLAAGQIGFALFARYLSEGRFGFGGFNCSRGLRGRLENAKQ